MYKKLVSLILCLSLSLSIIQGIGEASNASAASYLFTAYVTSDSLPIKSGPGAGYANIGTVAKNQRLDVLETKNGWLHISQGWVSGVYTTKTAPVLFSAYVTASILPIKSGAGAGYTSIGTVVKNQRLDVLETKNGWLRTAQGWVSGVYTTRTVPSVLCTAYVTADSLDIKSGPGAGYGKVGTVVKNQKVDVLQSQNGWLKIAQGWISGIYTTKTQPVIFSAYVTAVSLPVKSGPGNDYSNLDTVVKNQKIDVLDVINGWYKISNGWVSGVYTVKSTTANAIYVSGNNFDGEIGLDYVPFARNFTRLSDFSNPASLSLSNHMVVIDSNGDAWGTGINEDYNLGLGDTTNRSVLTKIPGISNVKQVRTSLHHTVYLKNDGTVWASGGNSLGALGNASEVNGYAKVPTRVGGIDNVKDVFSGGEHIFFIKNDNTLWVTGYNGNGILGLGPDETYISMPKIHPYISDVKAVFDNDSRTFFLKSDGTVWATGYNESGELGLGDKTSRAKPTKISGLTNVIQVATGSNHTLFLKSDGTVWATGENTYGQLSGGQSEAFSTTVPIQIKSLSNVKKISTQGDTNLFLKNDGTVWGSGENILSQLGLGLDDIKNRLTPVQIPGISNAIDVLSAVSSSAIMVASK